MGPISFTDDPLACWWRDVLSGAVPEPGALDDAWRRSRDPWTMLSLLSAIGDAGIDDITIDETRFGHLAIDGVDELVSPNPRMVAKVGTRSIVQNVLDTEGADAVRASRAAPDHSALVEAVTAQRPADLDFARYHVVRDGDRFDVYLRAETAR